MPVVSPNTRDLRPSIALLKTAADEVDTQLQNDRQYSDLGPLLGVGANGMYEMSNEPLLGPFKYPVRHR